MQIEQDNVSVEIYFMGNIIYTSDVPSGISATMAIGILLGGNFECLVCFYCKISFCFSIFKKLFFWKCVYKCKMVSRKWRFLLHFTNINYITFYIITFSATIYIYYITLLHFKTSFMYINYIVRCHKYFTLLYC